jgi:hypothetical protein
MALSTINPSETISWKKLEEHFEVMKMPYARDVCPG